MLDATESRLQGLREHLLGRAQTASNAVVPTLRTLFYIVRTPDGMKTYPNNGIIRKIVFNAEPFLQVLREHRREHIPERAQADTDSVAPTIGTSF